MNTAPSNFVIELDDVDILDDADNDDGSGSSDGLARLLSVVAEPSPRDTASVISAEEKCNTILDSMCGDRSELAICLDLLKAEAQYRIAFPDAVKHGGRRETHSAASAPCSFATLVMARSGMTRRTTFRRLRDARDLARLDPDAERLCFGAARLMDDVRTVRRIAAIDDPYTQRDVAAMYAFARADGGRALATAERNFNIEVRVARKAKPIAHRPSQLVLERIAEVARWQPLLETLDAEDAVEALRRVSDLQGAYIGAMERVEELERELARARHRRGQSPPKAAARGSSR